MKVRTITIEGKTYAVLDDAGKPIYVKDDGSEVAYDATQTIATIARLNGEAKTHREGKEAAETKLQAFSGIDDPEAAKAAIVTVKNLNDKKLVDAGEVQKVRDEAIKATEAKYEPVIAERDTLRTELRTEKIGGSFSRSKFISDKLTIPADLVEARFGKSFDIVDGKIIAKDAAGNPIYSPSRPGEIADFDEALSVMVDAYPQKTSILKGTGGGGSGAPNNGNGGNGGNKTLTRAEFDKLDPLAKGVKMKEGFQVVDAV